MDTLSVAIDEDVNYVSHAQRIASFAPIFRPFYRGLTLSYWFLFKVQLKQS